MNKEIVTFSEIEIEKRNFHNKRNPTLLDDVDIIK